MSICRPQGGLDIIVRDGVATKRFAGEALDEGMRVFGEEKSYRRMTRSAPLGICRYFAQMRGHLCNETDGRWAAQDSPRDAAAER
jgi:hypothetical protein